MAALLSNVFLAESTPTYVKFIFADPWDCSNRGSDMYTNIPLNVHWIKNQIELHQKRKFSKGFRNKISLFVILFSMYAYIIQQLE